MEDVVTIGQAVAEILDCTIAPNLPPEVAAIVRLRSAARRILEAELDHEDEDRLLRVLARQAARAPLALWSLEAIQAEIRHEDPPDPPLDRERAATRLRRAGYAACPTCRVPILAEATIDRAERWARRAAEERGVHEGAVIGDAS